MALRIAMKVTPQGLVLRSRTYLQDLERNGFTDGDYVNAVITRPRNGKHHRKSMAWIADLFDNQMKFDNREMMRQRIIVWSGHYVAWPVKLEWMTPNNAVKFMNWFAGLGDDDVKFRHPFIDEVTPNTWEIRKAKRTSFNKMGQQEFEDLYERMCGVVMDHFGFDVEAWNKIGSDVA